MPTAVAVNNIQGPWYKYERVTAAQLARSTPSRTVPRRDSVWDIEFADGELTALDILLSFDNFLPYDSEFVDLLATESGSHPMFFSCLGKRTADASRRDGTGAHDRRRQAGQSGSDHAGQGGLDVRRRHHPRDAERSRAVLARVREQLQTAILTGIPAAPITCRSFWNLGFRNRYNLKFFKDYAFGFSTGGFLRSIGVGDTSDVDFLFSNPIDDYTTDWICSHELTEYDPKNKVMCFFFTGKDKVSGFYNTLVIPYAPQQNYWNSPIILDGRGQMESNTIARRRVQRRTSPVTVRAAGSVALAAGKTINVAVVNGDTRFTVANKIRVALGADADVCGFLRRRRYRGRLHGHGPSPLVRQTRR
jgi:hypothetical protein